MPSYKEKFINELGKEDKKIAVSGLIIDKEDNLIFIDDGTGVLAVDIETNLLINTFVRVFGYLINNGDMKLKGEVIQDLSPANKQIYNKVKILLNQKQ